MIEGSFEPRTLANMNVALDRVCRKIASGEDHNVRKRVAKAIVQCARSGKTTLAALTEAAAKELWRIGERRRSPKFVRLKAKSVKTKSGAKPNNHDGHRKTEPQGTANRQHECRE
jgi:hypothetical protein